MVNIPRGVQLGRVWVLVALLFLCANGATGDIVRDIVSLAPSRSHSYGEYIAVLRDLSTSDRLHIETIGRSHEDRQVVLAMARAPEYAGQPADRMPPCVLIIARQHGTEEAGTEAVLALLRHFATTNDPISLELLRQMTIATVPMANPDGVAHHQRRNAADVDLNRDWQNLSQPGTRAIAGLIDRLRPLAIIDMHELPAQSSKAAFAQNFVQTFGSDASIPWWLSDDCRTCSLRIARWMPQYGLPVNLYYDYSTDKRSLCHRYMGLVRRVPAYLFESKTGPGHPLDERVAFHVLGALIVGNYLIHTYYDGNQRREPVIVRAAPPQGSPEPAPKPEPEEPQSLPPQPMQPPAVEIAQPADGSVAEGRMPILVDVTGDGFAYVAFEVDGVLRSMATAPPYVYTLDTEQCETGRHTIKVSACDTIGTPLASRQCTFVVSHDAQPAR